MLNSSIFLGERLNIKYTDSIITLNPITFFFTVIKTVITDKDTKDAKIKNVKRSLIAMRKVIIWKRP